jgi:hypothetical protein
MAFSAEEWIDQLYPELALSPAKDMYIEDAVASLSSAVFGTQYNKAVALLACHEFYMTSRPANETGLVTSKTEGRTSISFWNSIKEGSSSTYGLSSFGKQLKAMIRRLGISASVGDPDVL